jgi:AraC family transcriptional regulator of adaptative response / DNA-3-methyladenine glycosylase II
MNKLNLDYCHLGTRLPGSFEPFEMCVRAILGQQITVKAARTLAGRMVETFGTPIETNIDGLTHIFPTPDKIISLEDNIEEHLGLLGIIKTRSNTILALAHAFEDRSIDFYRPASPQEEIEKLIELPGIGMWSAQYIAMRAMGWTDAFPHTDLGVMKALDTRKPKEILEAAEMWRPWRGYATINLWNYETRKETKK